MEEYSSQRPKRNSIKAHKAALEGRGTDSEARTKDKHADMRRSAEKGSEERRQQGNRQSGKRQSGKRPAESRTPEDARRRAAARAKRRRKRKIRRAILIGIMALLLLLCVFMVRAVVKKFTGDGKEPATTTSVEVETKKETEEAKAEEASAVIHFSGDIIMHKPFLTSSVYYDGSEYDYNPIFQYVKEYYEKADFAICTTEYAMTGGNYSGYPTFCAPDAIADALAENGIDLCLLANNHIYDGGDEGLQRTMEVLEKDSIQYTGARKTEDDKNYLVQEINGIKVGFFNYVFETEVVDGHKTINGIALSSDSENLINTFQEADPDSFYEEAEEILAAMKEEGVEYTIACMHWGVEYQTEENANQEAIAQKLCDMGVDALIASHPHVIQPVDLLESSDGEHQMVCAYAIGNHLSNQRTEYMDGLTYGYSEDGLMVTLTIQRNAKGEISLTGADFIPTWVYLAQNPDNEYFILPLNDPDSLGEKTGLSYIDTDVSESLQRTESIVGDGVKKVQDALPIQQKDPSIQTK